MCRREPRSWEPRATSGNCRQYDINASVVSQRQSRRATQHVSAGLSMRHVMARGFVALAIASVCVRFTARATTIQTVGSPGDVVVSGPDRNAVDDGPALQRAIDARLLPEVSFAFAPAYAV